MSTEIREWLDAIWEYCQDHWGAVAAGAAVALLLLVSFSLIIGAKRDDRDAAEETEAGDDADQLPEVLPEAQPEPGSKSEPAENPAAGSPQSMVEQLMKHVEEVSAAAGQKVESIELKIEKAKLTIRYAGASEPGTEEEASEKMVLTETRAGGKSELESDDFVQIVQEETDMPAPAESVKPKKFGVENMNMARSGRVYTEEELLNQIRD